MGGEQSKCLNSEYFNIFFQFKPDLSICGIFCHIFNYVGLLLFSFTMGKSVFDLIVREIIHKDEPWKKMSWRKVFHFLIPISQLLNFVAILIGGMYCASPGGQLYPVTILTTLSSYIIIVCVLINALYWCFLSLHSKNTTGQVINTKRTAMIQNILIGLIVVFFVVIPVGFEIPIAYFEKKNDSDRSWKIHRVEYLYSSFLNIFIIFSIGVSWVVVIRMLQGKTSINTLRVQRNRRSWQMGFYVFFFLIRTVCMLITGMSQVLNTSDGDDDSKWEDIRRILLFASDVGDAILILIMLHYLAKQKGTVPTKSHTYPSGYTKEEAAKWLQDTQDSLDDVINVGGGPVFLSVV